MAEKEPICLETLVGIISDRRESLESSASLLVEVADDPGVSVTARLALKKIAVDLRADLHHVMHGVIRAREARWRQQAERREAAGKEAPRA